MATITQLSDGGYLETNIARDPVSNSTALFAQKYTAGGDKVGPEHIFPRVDQAGEPQIAVLSNGGFAVGTFTQVFAAAEFSYQVFDGASNEVGAVSATNSNLAASPEGGFLVVHNQHVSPDFDGPERYVRLYDNAGTRVFEEGPIIGHSPQIAVLGNGDYQLTWNDTYNNATLVFDPSNPQDLTPPIAPTITLIDDAPGSGSDPFVINDSTPTIRIAVSEPGKLQFIHAFNDNASSSTVTAEDVARGYVETGVRGFDGEHWLRVRALDADGLASGYQQISYTVDSQTPGAAEVLRALDNQGPAQGEIADGGSTDDRSPALQFSLPGAKVGDAIQIFSGSAAFGQPITITETDVGRGYLSFTPNLEDGTYGFSARITDRAGNVGPQGTSFDFTVGSSGAPTTVSINGGGSKAEGNSGSTPFDFLVTRSGDTTLTTLVDYFVIGQTNASDFASPTSGTLTFNPGETSKAVSVAVAGDTLVEPDEAFTVGLSNARGGTIGNGSAEATVLNDDGGAPPPPPPAGTQLAVSGGASKAEGNSGTTPFDFTVTRSGDSTGQTLADYFVIGQTDAADFAGSTTGTVYFLPGEVSKSLTIQVAGDTVVEGNEAFTLGLSNVRGGTIDQGQSNATILNDDGANPPPPPTGDGQVINSPGPGSTLQGGAGNDTLNASQGPDVLTGGGGGDTFAWAALPWNAGRVTDFTLGSDRLDLSAIFRASGYTGSDPVADGRMRFDSDGAGGTRVHFDRDAPNAGDWPFLITTLQDVSPTGLTWAQISGNAAPPPRPPAEVGFAQMVVEKAEGNSGPTPFDFTVTRTGDTTGATSVDWAVIIPTSGGVTTADFAGPLRGSLAFAPGETTKTFTVQVAGDTAVEAAEAFDVALYNVSGGIYRSGDDATGRILNDDTAQPPPSGQVLTSDQYGDTLVGGAGSDTLIAGQGPDQLTGSGGADHFVYAKPPWNAGVITDFQAGSDKIDVSALLDAYSGSNPIADGWLRLDNAGGSTKVYVDIDGAGGEWPFLITTLQGVGPSNVGLGDFIF